MRLLESKTFKEQSERIWLSLLRLSLDPIKRIAEMAQVNILYPAAGCFLQNDLFL